MAVISRSRPLRALNSKIRSRESLKRHLARHAKSHRQVVFTNGCFDLIHPGHVTYLEAARKLGSHLIVALNSDASVRRLKGAARPLNTLEDRARVVAALESVDYVTWYEEDIPLKTILMLKPLVLVKGGDWKPEAIIGGSEVLGWGGRVRSLKYLPGHSTTNLIQRSRK